jgi:WXG100 family type VII secretion target
MKVNFAALAQAHGDLGRGISDLDTKLADLHRQAQPLVQTWTGDAQAAYNERHTTWTKAATELKEILASIQRALHQSLEEYQTTESTITKSFS